jgi:hypothetical protein
VLAKDAATITALIVGEQGGDPAPVQFAITCDCASAPGCVDALTQNGNTNVTVCQATQAGTIRATQMAYVDALVSNLESITELSKGDIEESGACTCTEVACQNSTFRFLSPTQQQALGGAPSPTACGAYQSQYDYVTVGGGVGIAGLQGLIEKLDGANLLFTLAGAGTVDLTKTIA